MFGFKGRRTRNIKVGSRGPTLHTGPRKPRMASTFCDTIGQFLYEVCSAVLFKFGGHPEEDFEPGVWGKYVNVKRCTDTEVRHYAHEVIRAARIAMKQNQLLAFEVAIVDGSDYPLCTFNISFRRNSHFRDCPLWQVEAQHKELINNLSHIIQKIQNIPVTEEMQGYLSTIGSRMRIRLQVDDGFKETADGLDLIKDSVLPQPYQTRFVEIGDPVKNLFNRLTFAGLISFPPGR